jgi:hypothetical protein
MNLIQLMFSGRRVRLEELASQIAERAMAEVERRLSNSIHAMSSAEARGYVRARAARPVRQQMQFVLAGVPALTPEQTQEVLARATDRTVMLVVSEMVKSSRGSRMRRAA